VTGIPAACHKKFKHVDEILQVLEQFQKFGLSLENWMDTTSRA